MRDLSLWRGRAREGEEKEASLDPTDDEVESLWAHFESVSFLSTPDTQSRPPLLLPGLTGQSSVLRISVA